MLPQILKIDHTFVIKCISFLPQRCGTGTVRPQCLTIWPQNGPHQSNSHMLLQYLHWLPIEYRINFKIASITFNTLHYSQPAHLHSLLCFHTPVHPLRSSNTNLLTVSFARTALGARSFSVASPKMWNSLPPALRSRNCSDRHFPPAPQDSLLPFTYLFLLLMVTPLNMFMSRPMFILVMLFLLT